MPGHEDIISFTADALLLIGFFAALAWAALCWELDCIRRSREAAELRRARRRRL